MAGNTPPAAPRSAAKIRERLVLMCMGVVTAAFAAMLYQQFGVSLSASILLGGVAWCAFMLIQSQVKKGEEIAKLKADLARVQSELHRVGGEVPVKPTHDPHHAAAAQRQGGRAPLRGRGRPVIPEKPASDTSAKPEAPLSGPTLQPIESGPDAVSAPLRLDPAARWETAPGRSHFDTPAPAMAAPQTVHPAQAPVPPQPAEAPLWPGTSLSADPMRDQFAFRPHRAASEIVSKASPRGLPRAEDVAPRAAMRSEHEPRLPAPGPVAPPSASNVSSIDADLEMVQRKIKALADEVSTAEAMKALVQPQPVEMPNAIEKTIGALKVTAGVMREPRREPAAASREPELPELPVFEMPAAPSASAQNSPSAALTPAASAPASLPADLFIPSTAQTIAASAPGAAPDRAAGEGDVMQALAGQELPAAQTFAFDPSVFEALARATAPPPVSPHVAALTHAIEDGRMDVFLSPIVGLDSYDVRHYEVVVRLKSASGDYFDDQDQNLRLGGANLLALFDAARLSRTAIVADRLDARGKSGALLSPVAGTSMTDGDFLDTFAQIYETRSSISSQLVLTFSQADMDHLAPGGWQALSDMHAFGFRFALAGVEHMDSDFAALAQRGFTFVKLPASAFIEGVPSRDHFVDAHELCTRLAGAGLTLVAETIDQEEVRAKVFGFGVVLGQGQLFGGSRQVNLDPVPRNNRSEAA